MDTASVDSAPLEAEEVAAGETMEEGESGRVNRRGGAACPTGVGWGCMWLAASAAGRSGACTAMQNRRPTSLSNISAISLIRAFAPAAYRAVQEIVANPSEGLNSVRLELVRIARTMGLEAGERTIFAQMASSTGDGPPGAAGMCARVGSVMTV